MAKNTYRVLKRRGRVTLIETANPGIGVGYAVRNAGLVVWSGESLADGEAQFDSVSG